MTSEDIDFKSAAILSTRTLYFITNWNAILHFCDFEGSILFPSADYGVADALFYFVPFAIISAFAMMFSIRNCKKLINEFVVIAVSLLFGVWSSLPA